MSVYINGMEMPEKCEKCDLCFLIKGEHFCQFLYEPVNFEIEAGKRSEYCPLVSVPPHGRLGDLDDFAKRMKSLVEKAENDGFDLGAAWYSAFVRHIELTPTIIPAEEGET